MKLETTMYLEIYHIHSVVDFAKAYKYITEYAVSSEREIAVRETKLYNFEIAVYCSVVRHLRIGEYLDNIGADWK